MFGLTGPQGNHGEDVKEHGGISTRCRATLGCAGAITTRRPPSHINGSSRRTHAVLATSPSSSCWIPGLSTKTGIGGGGRVREGLTNRAARQDRGGEQGSDEAKLSVLPTLWFRNSWRFSCGEAPQLSIEGDGIVVDHPSVVRTGWTPPRRLTAIVPNRCSATTRPTRLGCSGRRRSRHIPRTASTTTSSRARAR